MTWPGSNLFPFQKKRHLKLGKKGRLGRTTFCHSVKSVYRMTQWQLQHVAFFHFRSGRARLFIVLAQAPPAGGRHRAAAGVAQVDEQDANVVRAAAIESLLHEGL